jgi:hypothetical protein
MTGREWLGGALVLAGIAISELRFDFSRRNVESPRQQSNLLHESRETV